jgi:hypothetical protein
VRDGQVSDAKTMVGMLWLQNAVRRMGIEMAGRRTLAALPYSQAMKFSIYGVQNCIVLKAGSHRK